jgi:hypothetical protein
MERCQVCGMSIIKARTEITGRDIVLDAMPEKRYIFSMSGGVQVLETYREHQCEREKKDV